MSYLFETKGDSDRKFNKIIIMIMVVFSVVAGIFFYALYSSYAENELPVSQFTCGTTTNSSYALEKGADRFEDVLKIIEENKGYEPGDLVYRSLSNTDKCGGDLGFWFNHRNGKKSFIYCLGAKSSSVVELDVVSCKNLDDKDLIGTSADSFFNVFSNK